uniref:Uncharacterized protein n=1 Tax=Tanacetum cinerariifolium TaxID=118510 RepID=A0A6L2K8Q1_TANCI|nr:hypothetical protein [Tanacetum cinerariifolium]
MAEMFRLLRELTSSRTQEKMLVREESSNPITKNINAISLIKMEKEKGVKGSEIAKWNVMELNEFEALEHIESLDKEEGMEEETDGGFGKLLEEIHVTWTQYGKKQDKITTLHEVVLRMRGVAISSDAVRTYKRRRQKLCDGVRT